MTDQNRNETCLSEVLAQASADHSKHMLCAGHDGACCQCGRAHSLSLSQALEHRAHEIFTAGQAHEQATAEAKTPIPSVGFGGDKEQSQEG